MTAVPPEVPRPRQRSTAPEGETAKEWAARILRDYGPPPERSLDIVRKAVRRQRLAAAAEPPP